MSLNPSSWTPLQQRHLAVSLPTPKANAHHHHLATILCSPHLFFPICDPIQHLTVSTTAQFLLSILTSLLQLCVAAMLGQIANNRGVLHSSQNTAG